MAERAWPARLTQTIAQEIRRYREERNMSAQQLSDRCAQLGLEISRSTLADLENGRRATLAVAELLVLAAALQVPPVLLAVPVGRQSTAEVLPGARVNTWDAGAWVRGDLEMFEVGDGRLYFSPVPEDRMTALDLEREHKRLLDWWANFGQVAKTLSSAERDAESLNFAEVARAHTLKQLAVLRDFMRRHDFLPPPLPKDLAGLDEVPPPEAIRPYEIPTGSAVITPIRAHARSTTAAAESSVLGKISRAAADQPKQANRHE